MRGSLRLCSIFGISIKVHITFIALLVLALSWGMKSLFIITSVFVFVTLHELSHSLVARRFGVGVREITLYPIGGVASMTSMPKKPMHEFLISLAGPLFNVAVIVVFYVPLVYLLGEETLLRYPSSTYTWPGAIAYIYWLNLMLAAFNLIPAFPMDGGRILRALLAKKIGYIRATKIAANLGHLFALIFLYFGIVRMHFMLIAIAVFIYTAASNEEMIAEYMQSLKNMHDRDMLSRDFFDRHESA